MSTYCDNCGKDLSSQRPNFGVVWVDTLKFDVASASKGESACLCGYCHDKMDRLNSRAERLSALIEGSHGSGDDHLSKRQVRECERELDTVIAEMQALTRIAR